MTGKTHRVGGVLCVLGGFSYLQAKGLLLSNVNPVLQLSVMYPFALYGSTFSDLDHNAQSAPSKDLVSVIINRFLHLTTKAHEATGNKVFALLDAKHRSWQTHSDVFLVLLLFGLKRLLTSSLEITNPVEYSIGVLMGVGFLLGIVSHLILDMLTTEGIWSLILVIIGKVIPGGKYFPKKLSIVPKTRIFHTGGKWETLVRRVLVAISIVLFIRLLYVMQPYRLTFNL